MKLSNLLLFCLLLSISNVFAQYISLDWVGVFKGSSNYVKAFDINSNNEIASTGRFLSGTVDFNPASAVNNLITPSGSEAAYVCKLDSNRNYLWAQRFVGPNASFDPMDLKFDANGNVIICGYFIGTLDFDNSNAVFNLTSNGQGDAVVLKLDPN